jgi:hypothetical protein
MMVIIKAVKCGFSSGAAQAATGALLMPVIFTASRKNASDVALKKRRQAIVSRRTSL